MVVVRMLFVVVLIIGLIVVSDCCSVKFVVGVCGL